RVRVERRPRRAAGLRPAGGPHGLLRVAMAGAGRHRPWRSRDAAAAGAPRSAGARVTIVDVVVAILMLAGLVGAILPFLPGAPLIFAGALLYALATDFTPIGAGRLAILAALGVLAWALEHVAGMVGARRAGGSRAAVVGATLGLLVGVMVAPIGLLLGPLLGAIAGALLAGRAADRQAFYSADRWTAALFAWSLAHEEAKLQLFRFVDVLPALDSDRDLVRHLREYFEGRDAPYAGLLHTALGVARVAGRLGDAVVGMMLRETVRR